MSSGSTRESGVFEVRRQAQYQGRVEGACQCATGSTLGLVLQDYTRSKTVQVCGATIGLGPAERFILKGVVSLLLEPGLYGWQSRIDPRAGTAITSPRLSGFWGNTPDPLAVHATTDAFSIVGGGAGPFFARAWITVNALPTERIDSQLVVTDADSGQVMGRSDQSLAGSVTDSEIGTVPFTRVAGHRYKAHLTVDYQGAAAVRSRLVQGPN
jgi:hypothetical protein